MPSAWQAIAHRTRRAGPLYAVEPEDSDGELMQPLGNVLGDSAETRFGPDALLLCGFLPEETEVVSVMLRELGADFVKLVVCCPGMENLPLGDALLENQSPADRRRPALGVPRILFISGMTSEEVSMLIDAFLELELPATLFAAAVPRSMDKPLAQLFDEITGDHERLLQQQREPV